MKENWIPVRGWESSHEVSNLGRVRSINRKGRTKGKVLATRECTKYGHSQVNLVDGVRNKHESTHKIVAMSFIGIAPDGMEIRHLDGNPRNNSVENLKYGTRKENHADAIRHGTAPGYKNGRVTEDQADDIVASKGVRTSTELSEIYGFSKSTIKAIWAGRNLGRFQK